MTYKCSDCGNTTSFSASTHATEWSKAYGFQDVTIDGDGNIEDYGDFDSTESEVTDSDTECDFFELICNRCNSTNIFDDNDDEKDEPIKPKKITDWSAELT